MIEAHVAASHECSDGLDVIDCLRQAGEDLDHLWMEAVNQGSEDSVRLGEASQDVHRALIALLAG